MYLAGPSYLNDYCCCSSGSALLGSQKAELGGKCYHFDEDARALTARLRGCSSMFLKKIHLATNPRVPSAAQGLPWAIMLTLCWHVTNYPQHTVAHSNKLGLFSVSWGQESGLSRTAGPPRSSGSMLAGAAIIRGLTVRGSTQAPCRLWNCRSGFLSSLWQKLHLSSCWGGLLA